MKKGSVKWNIPDKKIVRSPRTPRTGRSSTETLPDRSNTYSDTFEESSKDPTYSDTFVQDSYSDTFVNDSSYTRNGASPRSAKSKDASQASDNISTAITATEFQDTTIKTAIDTEALETVIETANDFSETETHTVDSNVYSDTFESSDRTKQGSDHEENSFETKSYESSFTDTYSYRSRTPSLQSEVYDGSLDRSHVAPDYDGQSYMLTAASDDDEKTLSDDYSYTFEPTESSYQVVDPAELQREAELTQETEEAKKEFLQKMVKKLKGPDRVAYTELTVLEQDPIEEDVSEDDYLRHFCKKKIKKLKRSRKGKPADEKQGDEEEPHPLAPVPRPTQLGDYGLPDSVLEKAKLINLMSAMKKAASTEIHEPRKCPDCREEKLRLDTEDAERQFVLSRSKILKNKMVDLQVEEHLLRMNSISMIAEIARGLPRHSEKPEKILDKLFEPLLGKNVMR